MASKNIIVNGLSVKACVRLAYLGTFDGSRGSCELSSKLLVSLNNPYNTPLYTPLYNPL